MTDRSPAVEDCLALLGAGVLPLAQGARMLELDGLALLLTRAEGPLPEPLHLHGPLTERLEDLQLVHGEGPSSEAAQNGRTVLVPDLSALPPDQWLGLVPGMARLGVGAVFSLPVRIGNTSIGALTGHRTTAHGLSHRQLHDGVVLAGAIAEAVARLPAWLTELTPLPFADAYRAAGVLCERHGLTPDHAWLRLRSHALAQDRSLLDTARAALQRRLLMDDADDTDDSG